MTTYYVKHTIGDDTAPGDSDHPWAHCPGLSGWSPGGSGNSITSGDTVNFDKGETWTVSSGDYLLLATAGVTYNGTTYGSGTRAKFQATGTLGSGSGAVIAVRSSSVSISGFEVDGNLQATRGIHVGYGTTTDITNIQIDNCVVHDAGPDEGGWYYAFLISPEGGHVVDSVTITNCKSYSAQHEAICIYPSSDNVNNHNTNITVRGCEFYDSGRTHSGFGVGMLFKYWNTTATIEFNYFHDNTWAGIGFDINSTGHYSSEIVIRYNIFKGNYMGFQSAPGGSRLDIDVYGNLFINNDCSIDVAGNHASSTQKYYNNTIFSVTGSSYGCLVRPTVGTATIHFKNNLLYGAPTESATYAFLHDSVNCTSSNHSNNLIYDTSGATKRHVYNGTTYYDRNGGVTDITVWEATAQKTDPTFTGGTLPTGFNGTYETDMVPNQTYFAISSDNALNNGAVLGSPYDYSINQAGLASPSTRGSAYDIGAYEYVTSNPTRTLFRP